ncbi:tRNA (adenosine(37)-N6)-dimethylallyltransferase MiaA [Hyphococcus formosus]|uniref:tRNA (adenosine(37)-N6)-dimethylallyltransferase MiaA n=1 Tax=Hyphococcus formosus TaxID=3143534 RepID=UPI00398AE78F
MSAANLIFIAGPTAGGKSAAALSVAEQLDGEIVNADAMQVYRDLRVLTARPSAEDEAKIPHHLYGVVDGATRYSAGIWAARAAQIIAEIQSRGKTAIVVGGTGLYFRALEEGLSPIPDTPQSAREEALDRWNKLGAEGFRQEVITTDPPMARLPVGDTQRLLRAWEVQKATGKPLSYFQALPRKPLVEEVSGRVIIVPVREALYANCDRRAAQMLEEGAIDEVRALMERKLDPAMPVMKALGVAELVSFLSGAADREATLSQLQQNTRRFAKRQMTWFRNQAAEWPQVHNGAEAIKLLS